MVWSSRAASSSRPSSSATASADVCGQGVLAEHGGGDEGRRQPGGVGDLLPGQVLAGLGVDRGDGEGLAGGGVELGVRHEEFLFRRDRCGCCGTGFGRCGRGRSAGSRWRRPDRRLRWRCRSTQPCSVSVPSARARATEGWVARLCSCADTFARTRAATLPGPDASGTASARARAASACRSQPETTGAALRSCPSASGGHRPAGGVTAHDDVAHVQHGDGVLDARRRRRRGPRRRPGPGCPRCGRRTARRVRSV